MSQDPSFKYNGGMDVMPAVLARAPDEFTSALRKLTPYYHSFQIDIADGELVPGKTLTIDELTPLLLANASLEYDFHLMVKDYGSVINYLRQLASKLKIQRIFVHHKAGPGKGLFMPQSDPFVIGLAINPDEQVKQLSAYYSLEFMKAVQIMSVNPGAQGQVFIKEALNKIEQLRLLNYRNTVVLDGGINSESLPLILTQRYLPDVLAIGSYLTGAQDPKQAVEHIQKVLPPKG